MDSLLFGIIIGLFLYFAGQRFIVVAVKAFKQRKGDAIKREEEKMQEMIDKAIGQFDKKR